MIFEKGWMKNFGEKQWVQKGEKIKTQFILD
jgi:hypothetical protein